MLSTATEYRGGDDGRGQLGRSGVVATPPSLFLALTMMMIDECGWLRGGNTHSSHQLAHTAEWWHASKLVFVGEACSPVRLLVTCGRVERDTAAINKQLVGRIVGSVHIVIKQSFAGGKYTAICTSHFPH